MNINCGSVKLDLSNDINGNMYLKYNDSLFLTYVDNENLTFINVKKDACDEAQEIKYRKIVNISNSIKLKSKAIEEFTKETNDEEMSDDEIDPENQDIIRNNVYFPEDKYYEIEYSDPDEDDEPYFSFFGTSNNADVTLDEACYDTIIMNGNMTSNMVIFRSKLMNGCQAYRICFYTDGFVRLNLIGSKLRTFKLVFDDITKEPRCEFLDEERVSSNY